MRLSKLLCAFATVTALCVAVQPAMPAELPNFTGYSPVAITYTCPTQTGSLPTCSTSYQVPNNKVFVVEYVSGSATPIAPNANGTFATGQASAVISTQISYEAAVNNIIGPNYALANSAVWFFTNPVKFYSTSVPVVQNNGGSVILQGYLIYR